MRYRPSIHQDQDDAAREDYWKSFTDILATMSLVFMFIMLIITVISLQALKKLKTEQVKYEQLESQLALEQEKFETVSRELDNIAKIRYELYDYIVEALRPQLKEKVKFVDGRIEINTEIWFETGKADLNDRAKRDAEVIGQAFFRLLDMLEESDNKKYFSFIEIRGHTDHDGDGAYNRLLSVQRASSFLNEILPLSSEAEKKYAKYFKASGMSKFNPAYGTVEDQTDDEKMLNRRIEIYMVMNDTDIQEAIQKLMETVQ